MRSWVSGAILGAASISLVGCAISSPSSLRDLRPILRTHLEGKDRPGQLAILAKALRDPSPSIRIAAARMLGGDYLLSEPELAPLLAALGDKHPVVSAEVARALLLHLPLQVGAAPAVGSATPKAALPPGDPFLRLGTLNRENLEYLRRISGGVEQGRGVGPAGMHPLRMLEQTTLGPNVPMPIGSQGLPSR
jgi:hypothetical protein